MRVALQPLFRHDGLDQRTPVLRRHAFGNGDDATLVTGELGTHIVEETRRREGPLGHVDQVRAAVLVEPPGCRGGGQEAGMPAHDDGDIDAGQRAEIEIDRQEGAGDELGCRDEARRVVILHQVVVDGLGRMHEGDRPARRVGQDLLRAGRIVAADIDEGVGRHLLQPRQHLVAIGGVRLVARRAECSTRRAGDQPELRLRHVRQHDIVAVAYAAHAVPRAEHPRSRMTAQHLERRAHHRLVDHRRRAPTLSDHECLGHACTLSCPRCRHNHPSGSPVQRRRGKNGVQPGLRPPFPGPALPRAPRRPAATVR